MLTSMILSCVLISCRLSASGDVRPALRAMSESLLRVTGARGLVLDPRVACVGVAGCNGQFTSSTHVGAGWGRMLQANVRLDSIGSVRRCSSSLPSSCTMPAGTAAAVAGPLEGSGDTVRVSVVVWFPNSSVTVPVASRGYDLVLERGERGWTVLSAVERFST
jgi:hypothetical protein